MAVVLELDGFSLPPELEAFYPMPLDGWMSDPDAADPDDPNLTN
jgi:hypothetical protein